MVGVVLNGGKSASASSVTLSTNQLRTQAIQEQYQESQGQTRERNSGDEDDRSYERTIDRVKHQTFTAHSAEDEDEDGSSTDAEYSTDDEATELCAEEEAFAAQLSLNLDPVQTSSNDEPSTLGSTSISNEDDNATDDKLKLSLAEENLLLHLNQVLDDCNELQTIVPSSLAPEMTLLSYVGTVNAVDQTHNHIPIQSPLPRTPSVLLDRVSAESNATPAIRATQKRTFEETSIEEEAIRQRPAPRLEDTDGSQEHSYDTGAINRFAPEQFRKANTSSASPAPFDMSTASNYSTPLLTPVDKTPPPPSPFPVPGIEAGNNAGLPDNLQVVASNLVPPENGKSLDEYRAIGFETFKVSKRAKEWGVSIFATIHTGNDEVESRKWTLLCRCGKIYHRNDVLDRHIVESCPLNDKRKGRDMKLCIVSSKAGDEVKFLALTRASQPNLKRNLGYMLPTSDALKWNKDFTLNQRRKIAQEMGSNLTFQGFVNAAMSVTGCSDSDEVCRGMQPVETTPSLPTSVQPSLPSDHQSGASKKAADNSAASSATRTESFNLAANAPTMGSASQRTSGISNNNGAGTSSSSSYPNPAQETRPVRAARYYDGITHDFADPPGSHMPPPPPPDFSFVQLYMENNQYQPQQMQPMYQGYGMQVQQPYVQPNELSVGPSFYQQQNIDVNQAVYQQQPMHIPSSDFSYENLMQQWAPENAYDPIPANEDSFFGYSDDAS